MRAGRQLVEHDAEREEIGAKIDRVPLELFGRHVRWRADDDAVRRQLRERFERGARIEVRETQIENLHPAIVTPHDIFRLQIAVQHARSMDGGKRVGDLRGDVKDVGCRYCSRGHDLTERPAANVLGNDKQLVSLFLEGEHGRDARVRQRRGCPRFAPQSFFAVSVAGQWGG